MRCTVAGKCCLSGRECNVRFIFVSESRCILYFRPKWSGVLPMESVQSSLAEGSRFLFPSVLNRRRVEGGAGVDAAADDNQPPRPFAGGEHGRYRTSPKYEDVLDYIFIYKW